MSGTPTPDAFTSQDGALLIRKKMDLAIDVAAVQRQEIIGVCLPGHAINSKVPRHLNRAILHLMRVEIGRPEFNIEVRDLSPDPSLDDVVPGLIGPGDLALRCIFAFGGTAG